MVSSPQMLGGSIGVGLVLMCLIKVYMDGVAGRELVAREVAFIDKKGDMIKLKNLEFENIATLEGVDISLIDTLNSIMVIKPKDSGRSA